MGAESAYLLELRKAIESSNTRAIKHYIKKIQRRGTACFSQRFLDGYNIIGVALRVYLLTKNNEILNLVKESTPSFLWSEVCNPMGQFPYDVAIQHNDVALYQSIETKTGGYYDHEEHEDTSKTCEHLSSLEHLMSDSVTLDTFNELIETVLCDYDEKCYSVDSGHYRAETPLFCHLLKTSDEVNAEQMSALKMAKLDKFFEVETPNGNDKMDLLFHPWGFTQSDPENDPLAAAISQGEVKIAEIILQRLSSRRGAIFDPNASKNENDLVNNPNVIAGYIDLALRCTRRNTQGMIELLLTYKPKITPSHLIQTVTSIREPNDAQDAILSKLLLRCYEDENNMSKDFQKNAVTCGSLSIRIGGVIFNVEGSLLSTLIIFGLSSTLTELLRLNTNKKPLSGFQNISLTEKVKIRKAAEEPVEVSLLTLALLTNNHKCAKIIMQKTMNPNNESESTVNNISRITEDGEIKNFLKLYDFLISIRHSVSPKVWSIIDYVFSQEGCISEDVLAQHCQMPDLLQPGSPSFPYFPYFPTFPRGCLDQIHSMRALVEANPTIGQLGRATLISLIESRDNKEMSWNKDNAGMPSHVASCNALGIIGPASLSDQFDVLTAMYTASSTSKCTTVTALLIQFALYSLISMDDLMRSVEARVSFLGKLDRLLRSQSILSQIDIVLANRIRKLLQDTPYPTESTLCISNNTQGIREFNDFADMVTLYPPLPVDTAFAIRDPELSQLGAYCFKLKRFYELPFKPEDSGRVDRLILRLITTLTYHATNSRCTEVETLKRRHYKCYVILQVLPALEPKFKEYTLEEYYQEQCRMEQFVVCDYVSDDISDDSDEELKPAPLNVYEQRHFEEIVADAQVSQLTDESGQLKSILLLDDAGKPKQNRGGGLDYDKRKMKSQPNKRAQSNGETTLHTYPVEKFKKVKGVTITSPEDIQRHVQEEIKRVNAEYNKKKQGFYANVTTPFFLHFTRGVHYNRADWNADDRREHRGLKEDELKPAHYASAVFSEHNLTVSSGALVEKTTADTGLEPTARLITDNLHQLQDKGEEGFYHALHNVYSANYDGFKAFLAQCKLNPNTGSAEEQRIKKTVDQYFINQSNHFVSTAGTPYHALKYAYGLKTYPGHQEERLRPRWRRDGRAERPVSGKAYIYLLSLQQYAELKPYDIPSEYDNGNSGLVGVYRAERETSFFGKIPEGTVFMQHIAKYPSFNGPYKPQYFAKYGLTPELYALFGNAFKNTAPHTPENQNAKTILGEWLCAFHEVRILRELTARVISCGGVILYHDATGFSEHLPKVIDSNNKQKLEVRKDNDGQEKIAAWRQKITKISKDKLAPELSATPAPQAKSAPKRRKLDVAGTKPATLKLM